MEIYISLRTIRRYRNFIKTLTVFNSDANVFVTTLFLLIVEISPMFFHSSHTKRFFCFHQSRHTTEFQKISNDLWCTPIIIASLLIWWFFFCEAKWVQCWNALLLIHYMMIFLFFVCLIMRFSRKYFSTQAGWGLKLYVQQIWSVVFF